MDDLGEIGLRTLAYLIGDAVELSVSSLVMSEATRMAMLKSRLTA